MTPLIRQVVKDDIDAIFSIEERSFSYPFTLGMFVAMVGHRPFLSLVAEMDGKIVGYIFYSLAADEMELLTVAVDEAYRRRGIARLLIEAMIIDAGSCDVRAIFLEVRVSNIAAQDLYSSLGFNKIAMRPGYYVDNKEDAIVMEKKIR